MSTPGQTSRVLVIDDHPHAAQLVAAVLAPHFDDVVACSTTDAAERSAQDSFDLLIAGMHASGGLASGIGVLSQVRAVGCTAPAIVLTAIAGGLDADEADAMGVVGVLHRPIRLDDLERLALSALNLGSAAPNA